MKILIFSDIHGNLPAFKKILAKEKNINSYISLGDVVGYGPWSNQCVDLLEKLPNCIKILGNHEQAFLDKKINSKLKLVHTFFNFTLKNFNKFNLIKNYQHKYLKYNYIFTHTINNLKIFKDTQIKIKNNYFIGHSHQQFSKKINKHYLHNPGSVGQNRSNLNIINYSIFDSQSRTVYHKKINYHPTAMIAKMKKNNYPQECIDYYLQKINYAN